MLQGLSEHFFSGVTESYFSTSYTEEVLDHRSNAHRGNLEVVYLLPQEPIRALAGDHRSVAQGLISLDTVKLATVALWQVVKIDGLISQQATFNAVHAADLYDKSLSAARREAVHQAGVTMSRFLHGGIGTAKTEWYEPLKTAIAADLTTLHTRNRWWSYARRNWLEASGDIAMTVALVVVVLAFAKIL